MNKKGQYMETGSVEKPSRVKWFVLGAIVILLAVVSSFFFFAEEKVFYVDICEGDTCGNLTVNGADYVTIQGTLKGYDASFVKLEGFIEKMLKVENNSFNGEVQLPVQQGEYSLQVEIPDEASRQFNIVVENRLEVEKFVFAESVDNDFDYVPKSNREFMKGENMFLYMVIDGFGQESENGQYNMELTESVAVFGPDGNKIENLSDENYMGIDESLNEPITYYKLRNVFRIPESLTSGEYSVRVKLKDEISGESFVKKEDFYVKGLEESTGGEFLRVNVPPERISTGKEYRKEIKVYDGGLIDELYRNYTVMGSDMIAMDTLILVPTRYPKGSYDVEMNVWDGQRLVYQNKSKIEVEKNFMMQDYKFVYYLGDEFNSIELDDAVYEAGDTVNLYMELADFKQEKTDGGYRVNIIEDIKGYGPNGEVINGWSEDEHLVVDEVLEERRDVYKIRNGLSLGLDREPGKYVFEVTFEDKLSGQTFSKSINFRVEE